MRIPQVHTARAFGGVLLALGLGCGSSPPPNLHTIPVPAAEPESRAVTLAVEVRRPGLPRFLDRPEMVTRTASGRLRLARDNQWAGPLDELFQRALAENLSARLPNALVFGSGGGLSVTPDVSVETDIRGFGPSPRGVELSVQVVLLWAEPRARQVQQHRIRQSLDSPVPEAAVSAMATLVGQVSAEIARTLAQRPR